MEGYNTNPFLRSQGAIVNSRSHSGGRFWPVSEDMQTGPSLVMALPQPQEEARGFALGFSPSYYPEASYLSPSHPPTTFKNGNQRVAGMALDQTDPEMAKRVQKAYDSYYNRLKRKRKEEKLRTELQHITRETESLEREKKQIQESISILEEIKDTHCLTPQDYQVLCSLVKGNRFR